MGLSLGHLTLGPQPVVEGGNLVRCRRKGLMEKIGPGLYENGQQQVKASILKGKRTNSASLSSQILHRFLLTISKASFTLVQTSEMVNTHVTRLSGWGTLPSSHPQTLWESFVILRFKIHHRNLE